MKRIGMYTGKIFSEDEVKNMQECGICISDSDAQDADYVQKKYEHYHKDCISCMACPAARNGGDKR